MLSMTGFLIYIHIAYRHILSLRSSFMAPSFWCPTRDHNRATLLRRFFSVTLFNRYCFHVKRGWFLDSLTIFRWIIRTRWPETFSRLSRLVSEWGLALMSANVRWLQTPLLRSRTHYCNLSSALQPKTLSWCTVISGSKSWQCLGWTLCRFLQSSEQTQLAQFTGSPVSSKSLLQRTPGTASLMLTLLTTLLWLLLMNAAYSIMWHH